MRVSNSDSTQVIDEVDDISNEDLGYQRIERLDYGEDNSNRTRITIKRGLSHWEGFYRIIEN